MQKPTRCLWFDRNAEEAVNLYKSVFKKAKRTGVMHYGEGGPGPKGSVRSVAFKIKGREFMALNGGPQHKFTPAISLLVSCKTQEEVNELWEKLLAGGAPQQCGWLMDEYGLSWQIVPRVLGEFLQDKDAQKSTRVMKAMLKMVKLNIAGVKRAAKQKQELHSPRGGFILS